MFTYYLDLARRSLLRNKFLTMLMVLSIGLGIGASMTMITVLHVMSGNPLPGLSAQLYMPLLDPRTGTPDPGDVPDGFTWPDAMNLLRAQRADGQAAMAAGVAVVHPAGADHSAFFDSAQFTTSEFFTMFDVRFRAGGGWSAQQDDAHARVVVLNHALEHKLFGAASGLGQALRLNDTDFRVIGVLDGWHPQPAFFHQKGHHLYGSADQIFLPLKTALELHMPINGHFSCWGNGNNSRMSDQCSWVQFWVRLDNPLKALAYRHFLADYWHQQQDHGRFPRKDSPPHLVGLMDWLAHEHIVPSNLSMQMWLAIGFLVVCMLSVVALLLAKFLRRSGEISVRRAMGAKRSDIFMQFGMEAAMIGVAGGLLGLGVAQLGLWSVRHRPEGYAHLAQMNMPMLVGTIVLAIVASVLAGCLPAWRACQIAPALQLKTS
ncbi:MAG: ABC transporter permease [Xanthomonadales bacterium]|nr:ABC transporter permease [Xanthomonadales bacterium]